MEPPEIPARFSSLLIVIPLGLMCWHWIRLGTWPEWSFSSLGFEPPETQLLGINKVIKAFYEIPLVLLTTMAGFAMVFAVVHFVSRSHSKREAEHERHRELVSAQLKAREAMQKKAGDDRN